MLKFNPTVHTADLAPFFLNWRGQRFYFGDTREQKWTYEAPAHMQRFADRVLASVEQHGVRNPIICSTEVVDDWKVNCVRHGATRLWAARILGQTVPVLSYDHLDILDWEPITEREALRLFTGEHFILDRGSYKIFKAAHNDSF